MEDWLKFAAKPAETSRQVWRRQQRMSARAAERPGLFKPKRPGKRARLFETLNKEHPGILQFHTAAVEVLMTGPKAQRPTFRAILKTMKRIHAAPKIKPIGLGLAVPTLMLTPRHARGSWRTL